MSGMHLSRDVDRSIVRTIRVTRAQAAEIVSRPFVEFLRSVGVEPHARARGWSHGLHFDGRISLTVLTVPGAPDGATIRRRIEAIIGECIDRTMQTVAVQFSEKEWLHIVAAQDAVNAFIREHGGEGSKLRVDGSCRLKTLIDPRRFTPEGGKPHEHLRNALLRIAGQPERLIKPDLTAEERAAAEKAAREAKNARARAERAEARKGKVPPPPPPRPATIGADERVDWIQFQTTGVERALMMQATAASLGSLVEELGIIVGPRAGRPITRAGGDRLRVMLCIDRLDPIDRRGDLRDRILIALGGTPRIDTGGKPRAEYIREHALYRHRGDKPEAPPPATPAERKAKARQKLVAREREQVAAVEAKQTSRHENPRRPPCAPMPDADSRWPRGISADDVRPSRVDGLRPVMPQRHSARDAWTQAD